MKGYVKLKAETTTGLAPTAPIETFNGKVLRVLEWENGGDGALVVNEDDSGVCFFEPEDIVSSFKCEELHHVLIPAGLKGLTARTAAAMKRLGRDGGYGWKIKAMVIKASIKAGEFTDDFLF